MASMYHVTIRGPKAFVKSNNSKDDAGEQEIDSLLEFFGSTLSVEPGTTFDDIWSLIMKDADVYTVVFHDQLGGHNLEVFQKQFAKPGRNREDEPDDDRMNRLEVGWSSDITTYKDGETAIHFGAEFRGLGPCKEVGQETYYGFTFTPINDLKGFPFVLGDMIALSHLDLNTKESRDLVKGQRPLTVYDVIGAILDEISWNGDPSDGLAMKRLAEMDQAMQGVKDGTVKLIPMEDVIREIEDKDDQPPASS